MSGIRLPLRCHVLYRCDEFQALKPVVQKALALALVDEDSLGEYDEFLDILARSLRGHLEQFVADTAEDTLRQLRQSSRYVDSSSGKKE